MNNSSSLLYSFGKSASPAGTAPEDGLRLDALGGKGINLCRLVRAGFQVPPGVVITTAGYREFVAVHNLEIQINALISGLHPDDPSAIEVASKTIRALFEQYEIPDSMATHLLAAYTHMHGHGHAGALELSVAVRSSATAEDLEEAAFAGQQETYLNVRGEAALLQSVRACWASLWTARAITYRSHKKIAAEGLALAVVVQQMVLSEASGVLFTVNPVSGARDEIVLNAAWGLGEAIVSGRVTPDTIIVEKKSGRIKEVTVSDKMVMTVQAETGIVELKVSEELRTARVLSDEHVGQLVKIAREVEAHYGAPQDIEWCMVGGELYLVQARPVTALPPEPIDAETIEAGRQEEIERLKKSAGNQRVVWAIHNLSETLATPTPLTWDFVRGFMSGSGGFGGMYRDFGYEPGSEVCRDGFLELICGRIYADPRRMSGLFSSALPMEYDMDAVAKDFRVMDMAPTKFNLQKVDQLFFLRMPRIIFSMIRSSRKLKRARKNALSDFQNRSLPDFLQFVGQARSQSLAALSVSQLLSELERRRKVVLDEFLKESLKPGFFGGIAQNELQALLVQLMGEKQGEELTLALTTGLENDTTIEQNIALYKVARNEMPMAEFLNMYGHRAVNEMELAQPRWRENSEPLKKMLGGYRAKGVVSPAERHAQQHAARLKLEAGLPELLAQFGGSSLLEQIQSLLKEAQALLPYREAGKHYLMMGYETMRDIIVELAKRWHLESEIFFLQKDELGCSETELKKLEPVIAARKLRWRAFQKLAPPDIIDSAQLENLGRPRVLEMIEGRLRLAARPIAAGTGRGVACIVRDPAEAGDLGADYILVCSSTDPGWTPLFVNARGLIVERGGVLSHGAIVARDFGIPAVVCENATRLIRPGMRLEVDGSLGLISEIE